VRVSKDFTQVMVLMLNQYLSCAVEINRVLREAQKHDCILDVHLFSSQLPAATHKNMGVPQIRKYQSEVINQ
jgi:hypothetical protein